MPYAQIPFNVVDSPEHRALALEEARQSLVLLKNGPVPGRASRAAAAADARASGVHRGAGPLRRSVPVRRYSGVPPIRRCRPWRASAKAGDRILIETTHWGDTEAAIKAAIKCDVVVIVVRP